jgi:hypothetical protein
MNLESQEPYQPDEKRARTGANGRGGGDVRGDVFCLTPYFFSGANLLAVLLSLSMEAIMVVGMVSLMVSGGLTCRWAPSWRSRAASRRFFMMSPA